jgi:thioesterase domain-containing protein
VRVSTLFQAPTVEQFAILLQAPQKSNWSSLVALNNQGSRRPFFWVHGEDSDALLPRYLHLDQPLYGLRHQSDDGQPARYKTVEDIAAHYLEEIRSVQPQGPYLLGGYCFGGLVALEIAQRLLSEGQRTDLLALIEPSFGKRLGLNSPRRRTPTRSLLDSLRFHSQALVSLRRSQEKWWYVLERARGKLAETLSNVFTPVKKIFQRITWEICIRLSVSIPVSMRSPYILEVYRKASRNYKPPPYRGNVVLFLGEYYSQNLRRRWLDLCGGKLTIHEIPGDHTSVLREEPSLASLAKELNPCLDEAQQRTVFTEVHTRSV